MRMRKRKRKTMSNFSNTIPTDERKRGGLMARMIKGLLRTALQLCAIILVSVVLITFCYEHTNTKLRDGTVAFYTISQQEAPMTICFDNSATKEHIKVVTDYLNSLDEDLVKKMQDQKWTVFVTENLPATLYGEAEKVSSSDNYDKEKYNVLGGLTVMKVKGIYVSTFATDIEQFRNHFIHEIGHCIDYIYGYPSRNRTFYALYQTFSKVGYLNDYEVSSELEFFASCYQNYVVDKEGFKKEYPVVAEYLEYTLNQKVPTTLPERLEAGTKGMFNSAFDVVRDFLPSKVMSKINNNSLNNYLGNLPEKFGDVTNGLKDKIGALKPKS